MSSDRIDILVKEKSRKFLAWVLRNQRFDEFKDEKGFISIDKIIQIYHDENYSSYMAHAMQMQYFMPHDRTCYELAKKFWWSFSVKEWGKFATVEELKPKILKILGDELNLDIITDIAATFPDQFKICKSNNENLIRAIRSWE